MSRPDSVRAVISLSREKLLNRLRITSGDRNAVWSVIDSGSTPLAALFLAAGLARCLGRLDYGLIVVALAVSNLSAAVNPAISATTIKFVSESVVNRHADRMASILTTSLLAVMAVDAILILIAIYFGQVLCNWFFGAELAGSILHIRVIFFLAVLSVCLQQVDGVFAATLKGLQRFKQQSLVEVTSRFSLVICAVSVAKLTKDVRWVLCAYCIVCAVSIIGRVAVLKTTIGGRPVLAKPSRTEASNLLRFGGWMWLNAIATMALGTVDRIVIGRVSGPETAAEYNIYMQIGQLVHFVPASLFAFTYPVFSRLGSNKSLNIDLIRLLYKRYSRLAACIGITLAAGIFILRHQLLLLFGRAVLEHGHDFAFGLLIFNFALLSLNVVPYCLTLGIGRPRFVSLVTSLSMLVSVASTSVLIPAFGIEGAAAARLAYGMGALALVVRAHRLLEINDYA